MEVSAPTDTAEERGNQKRSDDMLDAIRSGTGTLVTAVDAEYASDTFISVTTPAEFEVRVSTTGLPIREIASGA